MILAPSPYAIFIRPRFKNRYVASGGCRSWRSWTMAGAVIRRQKARRRAFFVVVGGLL